MLILLPPSEGKTVPKRGNALDLDNLSFPTLNPTRQKVLDALIEVCGGDGIEAMRVLGLGKTQGGEVARNAHLRDAHAGRADRVYSGVLFSALDLPSLTGNDKRRATTSVAITSALFGLVRPGDRIPSYRLSGDVSLPPIGSVAALWRGVLGQELAAERLLIDLRSGMYAALYRPQSALAARTSTVRVLHEHLGERKVVSHFNKASKGQLARDLLTSGATPRTVDQLVATLRDLGWVVERDGNRLDVIVDEV